MTSGTDVAIVLDESTRWGPDPYAAMVAAHKERQARIARAAFQAQRDLVAEAAAKATNEAQVKEAVCVARIVDKAQRASPPGLRLPLQMPKPREAALRPTPAITSRQIIAIVAEEYGLPYGSLFDQRPRFPTSEAREIAMYEIYREMNYRSAKITRVMSGGIFAVLQAISKIAFGRRESPHLQKRLARIERAISLKRLGNLNEIE